MASVSESRLKGNYGAALVMARLSAECLVRPVAIDTDVGVDLYCETVSGGRPFLHFWVQVKAGNQCKVDESGTVASYQFQEDHLAYWDRQPVPVFAALVPTAWPVRRDPAIYVIDITTQRLFETGPRTLRSRYCWPAGDVEEVRRFLREVVPATTARLQSSRGVVASSPTLQPQYVHTVPAVPVMRFKRQILNQLRTTATQSILFALRSEGPTPQAKEFSRLLARIVELYDGEHWENFMSRAMSRHADEDYDEAVALYGQARACIQADEHVRDQPNWQPYLFEIGSLEELARAHQPLPPVSHYSQ